MGVVSCCQEGCAHRICFDDAVESKLRRTGETWVCPAGHQQHFRVGPTPEQKEIASLKQTQAMLERSAEHAWEAWGDERSAATSARRRARTCPLCQTVFRTPRWIPQHLVDAHGAAMAAPLDVEAIAR